MKTNINITDKNKNITKNEFRDLSIGTYFLDFDNALWIRTNGRQDVSSCNSLCLKDGLRGLFNDKDKVTVVKNVNIEYEI